MKRRYSILIVLMITFKLTGQNLNVTYTNATSAVQNLLGYNVQVSNATFIGDYRQLALFSGGNNNTLPMSSGVLLSTGNALFAATNNDSGTGSQSVNSTNYDSDLDQLTGSVVGAAVLEFDFVSTGADFEFRIAFASEEYLEYVGSQFNDAFGFFLSGPGISGPFSNGAINIATLPNGDPITINTVNHLTNSSYFDGTYRPSFTYDGKTVILTVGSEIQCGEQYHLKIAICNAQDDQYDSGVFLSSYSLLSNFSLGSISASINPVCEGDEFSLNVQGDGDWTYTWSDGQSGVGLKNISTTANPAITTYTVTATNEDGCEVSSSINVVVSSPNNIAPWMDGVNGTGEYTFYVNAGTPASFTSTVFNDASTEQLTYAIFDNLPVNILHSINPPPNLQNGGILNFTILSSPNDQGSYTFDLVADDNNACLAGISTFTFTIIIYCDQCPLCVYYENRIPSSSPLPTETKAARCIEAGISQIVDVGTANVLFQAGQYIELGNFFQGGSGFEAIIEPSICVTDCEDCCDDWSGFTFDELPNPFYMSFSDSDPTNDFIQVTDTYHPFCAYNAFSYEFYILDQNGNIMNNGITGQSSPYCCSFESPAPENPISNASIWWDGYTTNIWGNSVRPNDGVYFYVLTLNGCNGQSQTWQGFVSVGGWQPSGMVSSSGGNVMNSTANTNMSEAEKEITEFIEKRALLDSVMVLMPNPTMDIVKVLGVETKALQYQLFDSKGSLISKKNELINGEFSLNSFSSGEYYVWIFIDGTYIVRKITKL